LLKGASGIDQLHDTLGSLKVCFSPEQMNALDDATALDQAFLTTKLKQMIFGGTAVERWR